MPDFVSEDHCVLCSGMWASERAAFRSNLNEILLHKPVCDARLIAFSRNIGFPVSDEENGAGQLS
jgi:hypothetical protein